MSSIRVVMEKARNMKDAGEDVLSFASSEQDLREGFRRIRRFCAKHEEQEKGGANV